MIRLDNNKEMCIDFNACHHLGMKGAIVKRYGHLQKANVIIARKPIKEMRMTWINLSENMNELVRRV